MPTRAQAKVSWKSRTPPTIRKPYKGKECPVVQIPLADGNVTEIYEQDQDRLVQLVCLYIKQNPDSIRILLRRASGRDNTHYARVMFSTGLHRIIMNCPKGFVVDHADGEGLNNRRSNLRCVTSLQNKNHRPNGTRKHRRQRRT